MSVAYIKDATITGISTQPANHVFIGPGTQVSVGPSSHYPYRFNPTAVVVDSAIWYNSSMWSGNGSVFTPGFKGTFSIHWLPGFQQPGYELVIGKNATQGNAFDNSQSGATLALLSNCGGNGNPPTTYSQECGVSTTFVSTSATDYCYFGLYNNNSNTTVTFGTSRVGLHITLLHYNS